MDCSIMLRRRWLLVLWRLMVVGMCLGMSLRLGLRRRRGVIVGS